MPEKRQNPHRQVQAVLGALTYEQQTPPPPELVFCKGCKPNYSKGKTSPNHHYTDIILQLIRFAYKHLTACVTCGAAQGNHNNQTGAHRQKYNVGISVAKPRQVHAVLGRWNF